MRIPLMGGLLRRATRALVVAATLLVASCPAVVGAASASASYGIAPAAVSEDESCCIDCTQGYRYMKRGRYADALNSFRDGEKVYKCTHDTIHALFVSHFLYPQFECLCQLRRYEEATGVASRIMLIRDSLSSRSSRRHQSAINHAEATDTLSGVTLATPLVLGQPLASQFYYHSVYSTAGGPDPGLSGGLLCAQGASRLPLPGGRHEQA